MSDAGGGGIQREVAYRAFADEFDDADFEHSAGEGDRAPNYVITPTGARINRLFVVGVLTEVDQVGGDVLRGRVVDPTGAFVCYAGQYQPEAVSFLEQVSVPSYVAVTGKARTFQPDDSDRIFTSIRPESINAVDADTRDRWTVQAAEHTIDRVGTFAAALDRSERGDALRDALLAAGVVDGLAAGIPLAIERYGTTKAYLAAVHTMARQAVEVVAGDRDEVEPLSVAPGEEGDVAVEFVTELEDGRTAAHVTGSDRTGSVPAETPDAGESRGPDAEAADADPPTEQSEPSGTVGAEAQPTDGTDEMYEFDAEERAEIEEEYGTEFSTGTEVDEPGEAGIDPPQSEPADEADQETHDDETDTEDAPPSTADDSPEPERVDLEEAVVRVIDDNDDSEGAARDLVISSVVEDYDVDRDAVEDAIHDAMMRGECYEPDDGYLKTI